MIDAMHQQLYGNYRNLKFTDVWDNADDFLAEYKDNGVTVTIGDDSATLLYYLLYARYGNSTIASSDVNQFKYKVFSTIFMYGPTWERRLEIQKAVRELTVEEVQVGGQAIYNTALNPNQAPITSSLEALKYISQQNTSNFKKSVVEAYGLILGLLETDVTEAFIGQFKKLFLTVVSPELPLWYVTQLQGDDDNDD